MFGFGSGRKQATATALEGLRPYVGMVQGLYGIPAGFWRDPYILGFFHILIGMFAKLGSNGKTNGANLGYVLADVFGTLSNMNGAAISREATELAISGNAEFKRGSEDGMAIFLYVFQMHRNERGDPLVVEATQMARSMGDPGREAIASWMQMLSYMRRVKELIGQE